LLQRVCEEVSSPQPQPPPQQQNHKQPKPPTTNPQNQTKQQQDDIQGTAATAVAGLYGALRSLGRTPNDLASMRIVCVGAGSAGMGVVAMICEGEQLGSD
jgi:flagellar basal body P-ring protein FlgI